MDSLAVTPGELVTYEQYQNSDCLNGGVIRVENGPRFVNELASHHYVLAEGALSHRLKNVAKVLDLKTTSI